MTLVRFLRPRAPYNAGEVAEFPAAKAERLLRCGYATAHVPMPPVDRAMAATTAPSTQEPTAAADEGEAGEHSDGSPGDFGVAAKPARRRRGG